MEMTKFRKQVYTAILWVMLAVASPGYVGAEPVVYTADKWHTRILFTIDHMGLSSYAGRFTDFDIDLVLDEEELANSRVEVTVRVASIDTFSPELNAGYHWFNEEELGRFLAQNIGG